MQKIRRRQTTYLSTEGQEHQRLCGIQGQVIALGYHMGTTRPGLEGLEVAAGRRAEAEGLDQAPRKGIERYP